MQEELYRTDNSNEILLPMISTAAKAMSSKLQRYKKDHLAGGQYHNPNQEMKSLLSSLKPHNDNSESVLGCNDWITEILPNMAQATRSVVIEVGYNKTVEWLRDQ